MVTVEEGYLWKWTNYFGGWQQRWFILKDGTLTYYKDANTTDTGCRGSFKLEACNIIVNPVDPLRFDLTTSSQRIYLKANTKPCRQKWIIQLGTTKANISEEMPDVATVTLSSLNEHKSELKTVRMLLSEQLDEIHSLCSNEEVDKEKLKQCQAMVNELCEEFIKTLDTCTTNIIGDERDCSTPLIARPLNHLDTTVMSLGTPPIVSEPNTFDPPTDPMGGTSELKPLGTKRVGLPCTYFSNMADRFEDLSCRADHIPTVAFLDAAAALPQLLIIIGGKSIISMSIDISNNINKLKVKQKLNPRKTDTLQAMIHLEIATQTIHAKHSATDALLWLVREMNFTKEFLLAIMDGSSDMGPKFSECYERTLKLHHNMVSRSLYAVASKAIPYREDILRALGHDGMKNTDTAVLTDMRTYAHSIASVLRYIEQFYINNKLLS